MNVAYLELTVRELQLLEFILDGCTNKEIAVKLGGISEETVKRHLSNIFDKTGMSSRLELALFCIKFQVRPFKTFETGAIIFMKFAITPDEFAKLEAEGIDEKNVVVTSTGQNSGSITTPDVTLSYAYDGVGSLDVKIISRNSFLAKHCSDETIFNHVNKILSS